MRIDGSASSSSHSRRGSVPNTSAPCSLFSSESGSSDLSRQWVLGEWGGEPPESGLDSESKWRPPVVENPTRICEVLVGLGDV